MGAHPCVTVAPMRPLRPDPDRPPPGPFAPGFWRSPLRGPRLTAVLGLVLLIGVPIVMVTGLLSNVAYAPGLGANALGRSTSGPLDFYVFTWPTAPAWLYAVTQGLHVTVGLALFPVLLVKLWSVIPRLFEWPPVRSPAHALERASLALLVGGALFEFATGILNIQY
jgi:DMSO/TMAO reductase YedYZ molybdopterin-dependent catalytic subunit